MPRAVILMLGLAGTVIVVAGMKAFASIIGPTFLALILTVAVHPLHNWLRRKGCPSWVGVAAALVVVYGILVGLTVALALSVANSRRYCPTTGPNSTSCWRVGVSCWKPAASGPTKFNKL